MLIAKLQGMSDQQFEQITNATVDIQYLIVKAGGMATKSEDVLMARYGLDRGDAHTFTNFVESKNQGFRLSAQGVIWIAKRPQSKPEDYLEVTNLTEIK